MRLPPPFARLVITLALSGMTLGCGHAPAPAKSEPLPNLEPLGALNAPPPADELTRVKARTELGIAYLNDGRYDIALEEAHKALSIKSDYAPAHNLMALVNMALGQNAQAEASFQEALRLAPNNPEFANNYGWFLCQSGRIKAAFPYFERALRNPLYKTPAVALNNMGICALMDQDDVAGESYLLRALKLDPDNLRAHYLLADLAYRRGQFAEAREWLQKLHAKIEPTAETVWLALRIDRKLGDRQGEAAQRALLRNKFRDSPEYVRMMRGEFD